MESNTSWVISQIWRDVFFINYKVSAEFIRSRIPSKLKLDLFEGGAFLSVVPFRMTGIRFPFTPTLPFSQLWELNLRTYVEYEGRKGIYFFTLDTDHHLAQWIANTFFHLPYRFRPLTGHIDSKFYRYISPQSFSLEAKISTIPLVSTSKHDWLVERYSLFTTKGDKLWRGDVVHRPWELYFAKIISLQDGLTAEFFPNKEWEIDSIFYSQFLPVYFRPFSRLK